MSNIRMNRLLDELPSDDATSRTLMARSAAALVIVLLGAVTFNPDAGSAAPERTANVGTMASPLAPPGAGGALATARSEAGAAARGAAVRTEVTSRTAGPFSSSGPVAAGSN